MALKEYIEIKPTIDVSRKHNRGKRLALGTLVVVVNNILPFICGFYFMRTSNPIFVLPLVFLVFFNLGVESV